MPLHKEQLLLSPTADGDDQPPAVGQLLRQRVGDYRRSGGHGDPRPRRLNGLTYW